MTLEEITELSKRHGGGNVEDLLIWIAKKVDEDGRSVLIDPTMVMLDEMFEVGRPEWVRRHIEGHKDARNSGAEIPSG